MSFEKLQMPRVVGLIESRIDAAYYHGQPIVLNYWHAQTLLKILHAHAKRQGGLAYIVGQFNLAETAIETSDRNFKGAC